MTGFDSPLTARGTSTATPGTARGNSSYDAAGAGPGLRPGCTAHRTPGTTYAAACGPARGLARRPPARRQDSGPRISTSCARRGRAPARPRLRKSAPTSSPSVAAASVRLSRSSHWFSTGACAEARWGGSPWTDVDLSAGDDIVVVTVPGSKTNPGGGRGAMSGNWSAAAPSRSAAGSRPPGPQPASKGAGRRTAGASASPSSSP